MKSPGQDLLQVRGLTKRYGPVTVLNNCDLSFQRGSIHALLGANGAGKSTLVRMIAGLVTPSAGRMSFDGNEYSPANKRAAEQAGVEIVQQELNLIPSLSIAENLLLTRLPTTVGVIRRRRLHAQATRALERVGLADLAPETQLGELGVGVQQLVEIAAALDRDCQLMILDEPTAALSATESETLFRWLEQLRGQGVSMIYISHRLEEVKRLADQISILRDGQLVGTYDAKDVPTDRMVALMSGDAAATSPTAQPHQTHDEVMLRVNGISGGPVRAVSFDLHRGECLGIAGLVGAGRTELLRLIFGAAKASSGHLTIAGDDRQHRFHHPQQAVAAGLAMLTEDRKQNGLLLSKSIRLNATLASMWSKFASRGITRTAAEKRDVAAICEQLEVRCHGTEQLVGTLSGGNQQKVALGKWLVREADIFLLDEPTRGIDVAARRRIYQLIKTLGEQGKGIIVVSSDSEELMEICDRIAVLSNGRLVNTFERGDWSAERITEASFSGYLDRGGAA